ncbi:unnamed protein product [Rhizoctonia solani]|uniref:Jacalin-type lectin domain-containing protein n=1 Tax=Rhizoctonia solani TaxID=456999 RepID=A0A8H3CKL3_9AGAM|nr:unnamed protein product [Rhizoctonia solani]
MLSVSLRKMKLKNSGWLCGFRVDNIDKPQVLPHRVALYADGETPFIEETNEMRTEVATMDNKRESNYVHHGWSAGAIATVSPWTTSRIHATNRHNSGGAWVTKKILATRLRIQVLPQDLAPVPEFVVAMEEAVSRSTRFERLQAVYHALSRWGDVVPIEIEIGFSLTLTDTEANFKKVNAPSSPNITTPNISGDGLQLPASLSNSLAHLSTIKTASIMRKGAADSMGWNDDAWATKDVPATEWRTTTIVTVVPTICLLPDDFQAQLAHLYAEKLSYVPPLAIEPIIWRRAIYDNTGNASRTISRVGIRIGYRIESISVAYLDGEASRGGVERGAEQTFVLANGDYIIEMLTCADNDGWLCGLQFITNTGRCSAIYGRWEGVPIIARSRGGILAGFSIRTKLDVDDNEEITGVWGIWRHDYISQVPKENDVYSDYFGVEAQSGICFNDRTLIGNSSSMRISSVEIGFGDGIDSIQVG